MRSLVFFVAIFLCIINDAIGQARVWEEPVVIPTLKVGKPASHPTFKAEINMRGDEDHIYPYPYNSKITSEYYDKTYVGCFLENEFIKVLVTPDIGGKLYGAIDKVNNYDFLYWQPTVKPALISLTGPWVSGGIEWCYPSGHRHTNYQRIGHRIIENPDGSKTVWVGETEWVHGLRWTVGLTIFPGKSIIEAKIRMMNLTDMPQSQYMWEVAATHADSSYQLIYPTRQMTGHNRGEYLNWPTDGGIDRSWWKDIPNASSFFSTDLSDFFGGYDHGKNAGTVFFGNRHVIVGKKFWTWGSSPSGRLWDWVLSDGGGPYVEPQAGAYTTNQPDFHWQEPGEVKYYSHYFYPVQGIGGFKTANENGALNLEFKSDSLHIGVYATSKRQDAIIHLEHLNRTVFTTTINIDPSKPFNISIPASNYHEKDCRLSLLTATKETLISYSPAPEIDSQKPEPDVEIKDPGRYQSHDEKNKLGEFLFMNRDKANAERFFLSILAADSLDVRANLSMAQLSIERADYERALQFLRNSRKRDPENGTSFYLRGVIEKSLNKVEYAYSSFYAASHYAKYYPIGLEQVAGLDFVKKNFSSGIDHLDRAIETNRNNPRLWSMRATGYRLLGNLKEASRSCEVALDFDPLNYVALAEQIAITKQSGGTANENQLLLKKLLLDDHHYYVDLCSYYLDLGLTDDALNILSAYENNSLKNPIIEYYKTYCYEKLGRVNEAKVSRRNAQTASVVDVFPFRRGTIEILNNSLSRDSLDASAHYFLGLIYSGLQNGRMASDHLLKSANINPKQSMAWRNLGLLFKGYPGVKADLAKSRQYYAKAFEAAPNDELILFEFDNVREKLKENSASRLELLKKHTDVVKRNDDLLAMMLDLMVLNGDYDTPIKYFEKHAFNNREGQYTIHTSYMNACIKKARSTSNLQKSLSYYLKACEYPDNLKVKPRDPDLRGFLYYSMAGLYSRLNNEKEAKRLLEITAAEHTAVPTIANYYQAMALVKLQKADSAISLIADLEKEGKALIDGKEYLFYDSDVRQGLGHLYLSLVHDFRKETKEAEVELRQAQSYSYKIENLAIGVAQSELR